MSLDKKKDYLHFAAHSHHPWPNCTRDAHLKYWYDSADMLDEKWDYIFSEIVPKAQNEIAHILNVSDPSQIVFAPNTHEFIARILSCLDVSKPIKILTTDSEFHSFRRQALRFAELPNVSVTLIEVEPYDTFPERWKNAVSEHNWDLIFTSHVFFNSGLECAKLDSWVPYANTESIIVVDGYHSFFALPINLKSFEKRIFFLGGGYKYAQSGEGAAFMVVPEGCQLRPLNTGWFAHFGSLQQSTPSVEYDSGAARFWGSTFDPSGLYRFLSVCYWFKQEGFTILSAHNYVRSLKNKFLQELQKSRQTVLNFKDIILSNGRLTEAHFITFRTPDALAITQNLIQNRIIVDSRNDRLRFGFGLYQNQEDIEKLFIKLDALYDSSQRHNDSKTNVAFRRNENF